MTKFVTLALVALASVGCVAHSHAHTNHGHVATSVTYSAQVDVYNRNARPGMYYVWVPARYNNHGILVRGHWAYRPPVQVTNPRAYPNGPAASPHANRVWVPGHYAGRGANRHWVPGRWVTRGRAPHRSAHRPARR